MDCVRFRWLLFSFFSLACVLGSASLEASSKKTARTLSSGGHTYQNEAGNPVRLQLGAGLMGGAFSSGVTLNAGLVFKTSERIPLYAGVDAFLLLGANYSYLKYGHYDALYAGPSVGLALLGTVFYQFTFPRKPMLHITGGASLGPFIGGGTVSLALLIRPGFTYDFNSNVSISGEPAFGIIGAGFVVVPRALFSFRI